jgi:hypothetical protein
MASAVAGGSPAATRLAYSSRFAATPPRAYDAEQGLLWRSIEIFPMLDSR